MKAIFFYIIAYIIPVTAFAQALDAKTDYQRVKADALGIVDDVLRQSGKVEVAPLAPQDAAGEKAEFKREKANRQQMRQDFKAHKADPQFQENWTSNRESYLGGEGLSADLWKEVDQSECASGKIAEKNVTKVAKEGIHANIMAMSKSICRGKTPMGATQDVYEKLRAAPADQEKDALMQKHLFSEITSNGPSQDVQAGGAGNIALTYALVTSLMARESDFKAGSGVDVTNATSMASPSGAEAGPAQVSYGSLGAENGVKALLFNKYREQLKGAGKRNEICKNPPNMQGGKVETSSGTGGAQEFQNLMKTCWALAAEYAALNVRLNYKEQGPLRDPATAKTQQGKNHWGRAKVKAGCLKLFESAAQKAEKMDQTSCRTSFPDI